MFEVFNMGTGFCVIVEGTKEVEDVVNRICQAHNVVSHVIGQVEACHGKEVTIPSKNLVGKGQKFTSTA